MRKDAGSGGLGAEQAVAAGHSSISESVSQWQDQEQCRGERDLRELQSDTEFPDWPPEGHWNTTQTSHIQEPFSSYIVSLLFSKR